MEEFVKRRGDALARAQRLQLGHGQNIVRDGGFEGRPRYEPDGYGDAVADRLSDADMERLAHDMIEACGGDSFAQDLQQIIAYKFSESSEGEGE